MEDETKDERLDRNLVELLQELRVAQTGVQILFAFLLTLPFTNRFARITSFQRGVYFVTLLLAAAASACIIAPVAHHRVLFRQRQREYLVETASKLAILGLACLALAMIGAIFLISDVLFRDALTAIATAGTAIVFVGLWFVLPLAHRADK
jgi:hypothetical protein